MTPRIVAIDGAAGSGKSTLARALARALGLPYVNTGLMYRALTASAIRSGADLDDGRAVLEAARGLRFRLSADEHELEVEGYTEDQLHRASVEVEVSRVARHPEVRAFMRDAQRTLGGGGAVMEGRDIATVVFPEAPVKLFLQADPRVRESRRAHDRGEPGPVVAGELRRRDRRDARVNPFEPAPDAVVVDTTHASPEETLERALAICRERFG